MLRNNRTNARAAARTCGDCRFMTERMGVLRTHCEGLEPSQSGRRVGEKDAACPLFAGHMVKPGPSLAQLLGADARRAVGELTAEKPARPGRREPAADDAPAEPAAPAATAGPDAPAEPEAADDLDLAALDLDLAALEARARAAEARAQALEAQAALAEARARAGRKGPEGDRR